LYQLLTPKLGDPQPGTVRITAWLLDEGAEVHRGTEVAIIETTSGRYALSANGEGAFRERLFQAGAEIESFTPIAVIEADGENIPYDRPYSLAKRLDDGSR